MGGWKRSNSGFSFPIILISLSCVQTFVSHSFVSLMTRTQLLPLLVGAGAAAGTHPASAAPYLLLNNPRPRCVEISANEHARLIVDYRAPGT